MTPVEMSQGLRKYFKMYSNTQNYLSVMSSFILKEAKIDIIKFDDWLRKQHGEYDDKKVISMKQLIHREYGERAVSFIEKLL